MYAGGNVYFNGAKPYDGEKDFVEEEDHKINLSLMEKDGAYILDTNLYEFLPEIETSMISTELLGEAFEPEQKIENPDGSEILFDQDYFGEKREIRPLPGPFARKPEKAPLL